ncbi:MAG: transposase, partial [Prevotellaceae bacterium]|nr:transposase [Prevotellaceae bacterium]
MILLLLPLFAVQDVSHITGSPLGTLCQCRSKKLSCKHYEAEAEIKGIEVKLFFCKMPKNSKWHSLLTTNRALAFEDAFDIYATRWTIEVFFKECKQLLRLGKCEARSFEAQIAATTLCMLQHNMLSMVKRFDGYESLGALFRASKAEALELTVKERICKVIKEILAHIAIKMNLELDFLVEYMCSENEQLKNILN